MRISFAQLFVAATQRQTQFPLQLVQVFQFLPHIGQLRPQAKAHERARLHSASAQTQEAPNFAEFESQTLYPADKGQRFEVTFAVSARTPLCPGGPG
jgi:hypothetical protein